MNFVKIATSADNVSIFASDESFVSFGDSPYFSHYTCSAVDIYPGKRGFNTVVSAYSPVSGVIKEIHKIKPPQRKSFEKVDYVISIAPEESSRFVVRILHVKPTLSVGDRVDVGDILGHIVRSGYYDFWTDPHIHVEIRSKYKKLLIARGSEKIIPSIRKPFSFSAKTRLCQSLAGKITKVTSEYILLDISDYASVIKPFYGISIGTSNSVVLLDAGIPYYQYGIIVHLGALDVPIEALPFDTNISRITTDNFIPSINLSSVDLPPTRGIGTALYLKKENLQCKLVLAQHKHGEQLSINLESYLGEKISFSICSKNKVYFE